MCEDAGQLLAHAEVLVIGKLGEEAALALSGAGAHQVIVDLTRGAARKLARPGAAA